MGAGHSPRCALVRVLLPAAFGAALAACAAPGAGSPGSGATPAPPAAGGSHVAGAATQPVQPPGSDLTAPGERHLRNVRQLTFGGQNAEAYWSWDDRELILQITADPSGAGGVAAADAPCDRIFRLDVAKGTLRQLTHEARQTCAYFVPDADRVVFASTHGASSDCPPEPDRSQGYVWPLYDYDVYLANGDGSGPVNLTKTPGYDAEATIGADGTILFTSARSGDLELWTMDADGGNPRQLTHTPGYDGGGFFSRDGSRIVWRASRPEGAELDDFQRLLGQGLVRPTSLEIFVADRDGRNVIQLTGNGKANFAPYFTPDGKGVVFASNMGDPKGRAFDIWYVNLDGSGLEQVTHDGSGFNSFPMFSRDGKRIAFSSNRNGAVPHETNVFVAEWVP